MNKPFTRIKQAALLLAACFGSAQAAPVSPQVVAGQATFSQQGNVFSITNTPGAIINWQSFSVNAGETTRFIQQSADSAVLNRILGQDPTRILGALQSNGKVFLINPNGVLFGRDARVDVGALVASTLNISDADFLAGKKNFTAGPNAGKVVNQGAIATPSGGQVFLVAPNVENSGVITAPGGEVVLAAGRSVQLVDSKNPDLQVVVSAPADQAINLGQVVASAGRIGIYGALVNQRGLVNADSAVVGANGKVVLKSSRDTVLGAGSVTSARGAGKGGEVLLLGQRVGLDGDAKVDASGQLGGGTVLAGGDWQGRNASLPNAQQTWFGKNASIRADALAQGDGGKVVLWADGATSAYGSISARGAGAGKGGMVETSGHELDIAGIRVDAGASNGRKGTWLLDPYDIVVASDGAAQVSEVDLFQNGSASGETRVSGATLRATNADIVLQAQHDLSFLENLDTPHNIRAEAGNNIVIKSALTTTGGILEFKAGNAITLDSGGMVASPNYIDFKAQGMNFLGTVGGVGGILPTVTFNPYNNATAINVRGAPATGALTLNPSQLAAMNAYEINIGSSAHTGAVSIDNALSLSSHLAIDTAGSININAPVTLAGTDRQFLGTLHPHLGGALTVHAGGSIESAGKVHLKAGQVQVDGSVKSGSILVGGGDAVTLNGTLDAADMVDINAVGSVYQPSSGAVWAPRLRVNGAQVQMSGGNKVGTLAGAAHSGGFRFHWMDEMHVGNVNEQGGVRSANEVWLVGGALSVDTSIDAPTAATINAASIEGGGIIRGSYLNLTSTDGIGSTTAPLRTSVNVLDAYNSATGPTPIRIVNDRPLVVTDVVQSGSGNTGSITIESHGGLHVAATPSGKTGVKTTSGDITLLTHSPLGIDGAVTSDSGNIRLFADNGGSVSVSGNARVNTTSGSVSVEGGTASIAPGSILVAANKLSVTTTANPPPLTPNDCLANPALSGCAPILDAALQACAANPDSADCGKILPSPDTCKTNPAALGCAIVLQREALLACIANPSLQGCAAVLPSYESCVADPAKTGCSTVLGARDALNACIANPSGPNCNTILPSYDSCSADATILGCDPVLKARAALVACIANPGAPGCSAILPTYDACVAAPGTLGCVPVLAARQALEACIANPKGPACDTVLPPYESCSANPAILGCGPVIAARTALLACIVDPKGAGCGEILPPLAQCQANGSLLGCVPVLARAAFDACLVNPSGANCAAILPPLETCKLSSGVEGCVQVLRLAFDACLVNPLAASCSGILPTLTQCVADKSQPGCAAVLPTLAQCIVSPSLQGCSVMLPKLEQCVATPTLAGCEAVLPKPDFCATHPTDATCQGLNPGSSAGNDGKPSPVSQAVQNTVKVINQTTEVMATLQEQKAGTTVGKTQDNTGSTSPEKTDTTTGVTPAEKSGVKNEKPATKVYCN